jgi:hypothetical protein
MQCRETEHRLLQSDGTVSLVETIADWRLFPMPSRFNGDFTPERLILA